VDKGVTRSYEYILNGTYFYKIMLKQLITLGIWVLLLLCSCDGNYGLDRYVDL